MPFFEKIRHELADFIEQRDDLILLVSCTNSDFGFVLEILREIEQSSGTDVFLLFSDGFVQSDPFVSVAIERLRDEHRTACEWLSEQGGVPLPSLPVFLDDHKLPASQRLRKAIDYARSLIPQGKGNRLVWAMFPMEVKDWASYLKLIVGLVPWDGIQPWMRGVRLVFRSTQEAGRFEPRLSNAPRVRRTKFELTQDQIEGAIADQVNDEQAPVEQRMQALLSLAVLDYAYNRPEDAIAKYNHLLGYYQSTGNKALEAFVLNGLGDVAHRQGNLEHALERYECAVIPAAEAKEGMILASIIRNLGDVAFEQKRYGEAEQYFDQLDKLTAATLDAECKARGSGMARAQPGEAGGVRSRSRELGDGGRVLPQDLVTFGIGGQSRPPGRILKRQHQREKLVAVEKELHSLGRGEATR